MGESSGSYSVYKTDLHMYMHCGCTHMYVMKVSMYCSAISLSLPLSSPSAFLAGYPQSCVMSFLTGGDTSIPDNAAVSIITHGEIECTLQGQEVKATSAADVDTNEIAFKLPEIPPDSSHDIHMTLSLPSMQTVGVVNHTHQSPPRAWKHEVRFQLKSVDLATIPVDQEILDFKNVHCWHEHQKLNKCIGSDHQ